MPSKQKKTSKQNEKQNPKVRILKEKTVFKPSESKLPETKQSQTALQGANLKIALAGIAIVIVLFIAVFLLFAFPQPPADNNSSSLPQKSKISITLINAKMENCVHCSSLAELAESVKALNVEVVSEKKLEFNPSIAGEANELIETFGISRLPALVIEGTFQNDLIGFAERQGFEISETALVFKNPKPPYFNIEASNVKGVVKAKQLVWRNCFQCFDIDLPVQVLKEEGVFILEKDRHYVDEALGKEWIELYNLKKAPSLILSKDAEEYPSVLKAWENDFIGYRSKDGSFIFTGAVPFVDLNSGILNGLVTLTFIVDNSCTDCYNPQGLRKPLLQDFGIAIVNEPIFDVSQQEAIELIEKYKITKIPTFIISKEASEYYLFNQNWKNFGTVEEDGVYVLRNLEQFKVKFKNLS